MTSPARCLDYAHALTPLSAVQLCAGPFPGPALLPPSSGPCSERASTAARQGTARRLDVVELLYVVPEVLARLVALACDQHDVAGLRLGDVRVIAPARSASMSGRPRWAPLDTSSMIASGFSLLGLSEVMT